MKSNKGIAVLIAIILIFVAGALYQKSNGLFMVLPDGEYNSNSDCTFITNTNYGANGENSDAGDYNVAKIWIAVDLNGDGTKEGYGHTGGISSTGDRCTGKEIIANTPIGLRVVLWETTSAYTALGVCSTDGKKVYIFKNTGDYASDAILSCSDGNGDGGTCTIGQTKCEGTTSFTCSNNAWTSQGKINGKCGYTGSSGLSFLSQTAFNIGTFAVTWWMVIAIVVIVLMFFVM